MWELILIGLIGSYAYGQYSNSKARRSSFECNSTKKYEKFGTLTQLREKTRMIEILIDGYLFVKINPAGINSKGLSIVNIYNVPVGSELTYISVPLLGEKKIVNKYIVTEAMLHNVSSYRQEVPQDYMGSDMSI